LILVAINPIKIYDHAAFEIWLLPKRHVYKTEGVIIHRLSLRREYQSRYESTTQKRSPSFASGVIRAHSEAGNEIEMHKRGDFKEP
jgi:hypothetical protein